MEAPEGHITSTQSLFENRWLFSSGGSLGDNAAGSLEVLEMMIESDRLQLGHRLATLTTRLGYPLQSTSAIPVDMVVEAIAETSRSHNRKSLQLSLLPGIDLAASLMLVVFGIVAQFAGATVISYIISVRHSRFSDDPNHEPWLLLDATNMPGRIIQLVWLVLPAISGPAIWFCASYTYSLSRHPLEPLPAAFWMCIVAASVSTLLATWQLWLTAFTCYGLGTSKATTPPAPHE